MPYTITMDANTYARALATGNGLPNYVDSSIERDTIVGENALAGPITATTRVFAPDRPDVPQEPINRAIQQALCVEADGQNGPKTIEAIRIYEYAEAIKPVDGVLTQQQEDSIITRFGNQAETANNRFGPCSTGILNYLERTKLLDNNAENPEGLMELRAFLRMLNDGHNAGVTIEDADDIAALRQKIVLIRMKMGGEFFHSGEEAYLNQQWTPELLEEIRRLTGQPN